MQPSGDRLCTVPYAINVTGRIWLSGVYCWLYDGTDSVRFHYCKSMVTQVLRRLGYRHTLVGITVIIGLMIAQFSLQSPAMAIWMLILPLFILGMAMSTQFTAMNTITLADLTDDNASSGNSVLAVTQQLSISLGVAVSAAVLRVYEGMEGTTTVEQFHYTFITMGIITVASAAMFMLLKTTDGNNLIKRQRKSKPNHVPSESE